MIGRLHGQLLSKHPPQVLLDVGGVGYEVDVPMSTFYALPDPGHTVSLLIHPVVREDAHLLFGFLTAPEREAFRQLIKVSGVGARTALSVLSGLSVDELCLALTQQDSARLLKVPGIGKKTAERLVLELKDKVLPSSGARALPSAGTEGSAPSAADIHSDIRQALLALGYNDKEASAALKTLPPDVSVADGIRQALKLLNR